ncbi:hypothetical protein LCGC14_2902940 [marine sediment metagenome]|uniref:Uncharacterized protein n=1 Tax=marine sediment metagenome TaxID=412755 RepID=A0A0F9AK08_9ZZZZ
MKICTNAVGHNYEVIVGSRRGNVVTALCSYCGQSISIELKDRVLLQGDLYGRILIAKQTVQGPLADFLKELDLEVANLKTDMISTRSELLGGKT